MKKIYIDMDNVLADYGRACAENNLNHKDAKHIAGFFTSLKPIHGSIEAVKELMKNYDVYILSTSPWSNPYALAEKLIWVQTYLPELYKRVIFSHHKNLCVGDYLIDDSPRNGAAEFTGEWIQFGSEKFHDWDIVMNYITNN